MGQAEIATKESSFECSNNEVVRDLVGGFQTIMEECLEQELKWKRIWCSLADMALCRYSEQMEEPS